MQQAPDRKEEETPSNLSTTAASIAGCSAKRRKACSGASAAGSGPASRVVSPASSSKDWNGLKTASHGSPGSGGRLGRKAGATEGLKRLFEGMFHGLCTPGSIMAENYDDAARMGPSGRGLHDAAPYRILCGRQSHRGASKVPALPYDGRGLSWQ